MTQTKKQARAERMRKQHPGHQWMAKLNEEARCLIADLVGDDERIEAVKTIRFVTQCSLSEALHATKYAEQYGVEV